MKMPWTKRKEEAQAALARANADDVKVHKVTDKAERLKSRNGFAEDLIAVFGGRH